MKDRIRQIVSDVLGIPRADVTDELSRETADSWDSLAHLRIVTAVEQEFGFQLTMDEIGSIGGVGSLCEVVAKRIDPS